MFKKIRFVLPMMILIGLGACSQLPQSTSTQPLSAKDSLSIEGSLAYRERIALPPQSRITVTLSDISIADRSAPVLAQQSFLSEGRQVPLPFTLSVKSDRLKPEGRYSVRGTIHAPSGQLLWTTDTVHLIDINQPRNTMGTLLLVRTSTASTAPESTNQPWIFICGNQEVRIRPAENRLLLEMDGVNYHLQQVISASGARYETPKNASQYLSFWNKGNRALLQVGLNRYPICQQLAPKTDFETLPLRAYGNEPAWLLEISERSIELTTNYGQKLFATPRPQPIPLENGYRYTANSSANQLEVTVNHTLCHDSMSGMPYPQSVQVNKDGHTLKGCAGSPASLLQAREWVVEDIDAKGIIDMSRITLNFTDNRQVYGRAGCNNYRGSFQLTGEQLTVEKIASTQMACAPALNNQETHFLDLLNQVIRFDIRQDGALILESSDQRQIIAR